MQIRLGKPRGQSLNSLHSLPHVALIAIILVSLPFDQVTSDDSLGVDEIYRTAGQIVELRGYKSEVKIIESQGHRLELVKVINPEVKNVTRRPVLFVHGFMARASGFLLYSMNARPKDMSGFDIEGTSLEELQELLAEDKTANSLPLLMSNFGHPVYLLSRRPISDSIALLPGQWISGGASISDPYNLNLLRPSFWNYSFDEQALNDLPKAIDYIIEETKIEKVSVVAHSAGCAMVLMMLSAMPEYADKLSKTALFAGFLGLGNDPSANPQLEAMKKAEPLLRDISTLIDLRPFSTPLHALTSSLCELGIATSQSCRSDGLAGDSGGHNVNLLVENEGTFTTHEAAQLLQAATYHKLYRFDYGSEKKNMIAYNQTSPPIYDASKIRFKRLSLWQGNTDALVSPADFKSLKSRLEVRVESHYIDPPGRYFNHASFLLHKNISFLLNIPALKSLETDEDNET